MSIQDERELRERLAGLLDGVTPHPAPVASAVRRGMAIRIRRWISVAAALAVIVAGASIAPALLHAHQASPATGTHHKVPHYRVMVLPLGTDARDGVIGQGISDGKQWKAILLTSGIAARESGSPLQITATWPFGMTGGLGIDAPTGEPAAAGVLGDGGPTLIYGTVSADVTKLAVGLTNGERLSLPLVRLGGLRWFGLVLPQNGAITRAVAYSGRRELGYSVPFDGTDLNAWWQPGQAVPARTTVKVGSGVVNRIRWQVTAEIGPWGYCYVYLDGNVCLDSTLDPQRASAAKPVSLIQSDLLGTNVANGPSASEAGVDTDVRRVKLTYSDGISATFPAVAVGADRVVAYTIPEDATVVGSVEYGAAGQVVGSPAAKYWNLPS
jgi:hypothetical protein